MEKGCGIAPELAAKQAGRINNLKLSTLADEYAALVEAVESNPVGVGPNY